MVKTFNDFVKFNPGLSDNDSLSEQDPSVVAALEDNLRQRQAKPERNQYSNGMTLNIPDEYVEDYFDEYDKLNKDPDHDPLLMYILQKNAQSGFKNGPIGTDGYFESFDPSLNPTLEEDYIKFLDTYYK